MSKKQQQLKITGAEIRRPTPSAEAKEQVEPTAQAGAAPPPPPERLQLSVAVENPTDKPLHVWASRSAYEYDPATRVLSLYLTENTPEPPPGIQIISQHPRTPAQVVVPPGGQANVNIPVPNIIRRRVPGEGLGMHFVEEPIGPIDHVELHLQVASEPIPDLAKETPAEHRKRLQAHGNVIRTRITPTGEKEQ
jgi:hypothetical protein